MNSFSGLHPLRIFKSTGTEGDIFIIHLAADIFERKEYNHKRNDLPGRLGSALINATYEWDRTGYGYLMEQSSKIIEREREMRNNSAKDMEEVLGKETIEKIVNGSLGLDFI